MEYRVFKDVVVLRLEKGEEVLNSIRELCKRENIKSGTINGLGAANKIVIGLFKPSEKKYYSTTHNDDFEITNLTGNISVMNEEIYLHVHGTFANINGNCIGGHVNEVIISATSEIIIRKIDGYIGRKFDENIGLNLVEF